MDGLHVRHEDLERRRLHVMARLLPFVPWTLAGGAQGGTESLWACLSERSEFKHDHPFQPARLWAPAQPARSWAPDLLVSFGSSAKRNSLRKRGTRVSESLWPSFRKAESNQAPLSFQSLAQRNPRPLQWKSRDRLL